MGYIFRFSYLEIDVKYFWGVKAENVTMRGYSSHFEDYITSIKIMTYGSKLFLRLHLFPLFCTFFFFSF